MKVFVFSDSHLHTKYDPQFVEWVKYWSKDVDKIIIAGDFWDKDMCTFDEFVNSEYKETLFPLLLSKKTQYLYGNHDKKVISDGRVNLFSTEQFRELDMAIGEKEFHLMHGDNIFKYFDWETPRLNKFFYYAQTFLVKTFGRKVFTMISGQAYKAERYWKDKKSFLICGHLHYSKLDNNSYILWASGFGSLGGLIIDNGKLIEIEKYEKTEKRG